MTSIPNLYSPQSQASRIGHHLKKYGGLSLLERRYRSHCAKVANEASSLKRGKVETSDEDKRASSVPIMGSFPVDSEHHNCDAQFDYAFRKQAYSSSGFDLIGALVQVVTRLNPQFDIGPIDLSCAFTIADARHPEQPIIYCSDTFCTLTKYTREEILGRNCRFLQAPLGLVEKGDERIHTDAKAVKYMYQQCSESKECQVALINYRRDGSPFVNLLTIVPITWGNSIEPVYLVGFQVDLVERASAVLQRDSKRSYDLEGCSILQACKTSAELLPNSSTGMLAKDVSNAQSNGKAIAAQELAELISSSDDDSVGTEKWARNLLYHSPDLVHVISLKGKFLYVSPSVRDILGYEAEDLVGKNLFEFCHPSDEASVIRELRNCSNACKAEVDAQKAAGTSKNTRMVQCSTGGEESGARLHLILRMRHQKRGYEWIETFGKLHWIQGLGRKVVICTGRVRRLPLLAYKGMSKILEHREPGVWIKLSRHGLILSTFGSFSEIFGKSITKEEEGQEEKRNIPSSLTGWHLKDVLDSGAQPAIFTALQSNEKSCNVHRMNDKLGLPSALFMSTIFPSSGKGSNASTVYMFTKRIIGEDDENPLQGNQINKKQEADDPICYSEEAATDRAVTFKDPEIEKDYSIFEQISAHRSKSWKFELHRLEASNKHLREEIKAIQQKRFGRIDDWSKSITPRRTSSNVKRKLSQIS